MSMGLLEIADFYRKNEPQARRSQNSFAHPSFSKDAQVRSIETAVIEHQIAIGGGGSRTKSGRDFCDLGAWGFFWPQTALVSEF